MFKLIIVVIGVDSGKINFSVNKNIIGFSWRKDSSWGDYYVMRVSDYFGEFNLLNGFVYLDNIYFV